MASPPAPLSSLQVDPSSVFPNTGAVLEGQGREVQAQLSLCVSSFRFCPFVTLPSCVLVSPIGSQVPVRAPRWLPSRDSTITWHKWMLRDVCFINTDLIIPLEGGFLLSLSIVGCVPDLGNLCTESLCRTISR